MGMITVSDLEEVGSDDQLKQFKAALVRQNIITRDQSDNLRAFYGKTIITIYSH
jgi:hypothetical protein